MCVCGRGGEGSAMLRHLRWGVRQLWGGGETAFHSIFFKILGSFIKGLSHSKVFWSSILLKNSPSFKINVRVWLRLECGLF